MSYKTQTANMKRLAELLSHDLGYIYGEREDGPNGAKKEFLTKGRAFLAALAKDLVFSEVSITKNIAGIACSGEVCLRGIWLNQGGLKLELSQSTIRGYVIHYRPIKDMKDNPSGYTEAISLNELKAGDYPAFLKQLFIMKEREYGYEAA